MSKKNGGGGEIKIGKIPADLVARLSTDHVIQQFWEKSGREQIQTEWGFTSLVNKHEPVKKKKAPASRQPAEKKQKTDIDVGDEKKKKTPTTTKKKTTKQKKKITDDDDDDEEEEDAEAADEKANAELLQRKRLKKHTDVLMNNNNHKEITGIEMEPADIIAIQQLPLAEKGTLQPIYAADDAIYKGPYHLPDDYTLLHRLSKSNTTDLDIITVPKTKTAWLRVNQSDGRDSDVSVRQLNALLAT